MALFFPAGSEWAFWGPAANTVGPFSVKDDASALRHLTEIYASICSCQPRLFGYAIVKAFILPGYKNQPGFYKLFFFLFALPTAVIKPNVICK